MAEVLLVILCLVALSLALWPMWFKAHVRRKRAADPRYEAPHVMGIVDELYHPDAHLARQIAEVEQEIPAPSPLPGGRGRIVIRLPG